MKIAVTGAQGLLGWHAAARIHAINCAARFRGETAPHRLVLIDRATFGNQHALAAAIDGVEAVLHFAGVNRASDEDVEAGNPAISHALVAACMEAEVRPHVVYANSTHATNDSVYGRSKRIAGEILEAYAGARFSDFVLPHIFGECAKPYYNNVTATLIDRLWLNEEPDINPAGQVELLHAGAAAHLFIEAIQQKRTGRHRIEGRSISVMDLWDKLKSFHADYTANVIPDIADPFDRALFNTYRTASYPLRYPFPMKINGDQRGTLFESSKARGGGQSFLSTTLPGQSRGDHFHLDKVERFLVVRGKATIAIRKVLTDEITSFAVSGDTPVAIDMPPLHTHNIVNDGSETVITYFWSNDLFDPKNPDTYADPVVAEPAP